MSGPSDRTQAVYKRTNFIITPDDVYIGNTISCVRVIVQVA